jgi:hypothetical protein
MIRTSRLALLAEVVAGRLATGAGGCGTKGAGGVGDETPRWFQGVLASQGRQASPVFPFAQVEVLPCEHALAPRSWRAKR